VLPIVGISRSSCQPVVSCLTGVSPLPCPSTEAMGSNTLKIGKQYFHTTLHAAALPPATSLKKEHSSLELSLQLNFSLLALFLL
jgi:hypothetical protein